MIEGNSKSKAKVHDAHWDNREPVPAPRPVAAEGRDYIPPPISTSSPCHANGSSNPHKHY